MYATQRYTTFRTATQRNTLHVAGNCCVACRWKMVLSGNVSDVTQRRAALVMVDHKFGPLPGSAAQ